MTARRFAGAALLALAGSPIAQAAPAPAVETVTVTASRLNLTGRAATASQGSITRKELTLRPVYRVGQLLETVPGLVVTVHSGEGKANQYLVRGFNLDHGTDLATFIDDMPVNRPTNTHGQGYTDLNFLIPQVAGGLDFTKGPFFAGVGDFGAVASDHVRLSNDLANQLSVSAGTLGDQDIYEAGTWHRGDDDRVWQAIEIAHLDGPFTHPDNFRKINATVRASHGSSSDGYDVTAMYYRSEGRNTTDQPVAALTQGLIDRFGTLDPTDGSNSERLSLSAHWNASGSNWQVHANAYAIHSRMTLWNNFTHFLYDPVNGDQEQQDEDRSTGGGAISYRRSDRLFGLFPSETLIGLQDRADHLYIDRRHTIQRSVLDYCEQINPNGTGTPFAIGDAVCNADRVELNDLGVYAENTTHWTAWLRTILGAREEDYSARDRSVVALLSGAGSQTLFQPKASIALGPWRHTEIYASAGRGFHSNDVRGVFGTVPTESVRGGNATPLMSKATSVEVGLRTTPIRNLDLQLAAFQVDFESELAYNADSGQDTASAPSRRRGVELSAEYRPATWLEINADLAATHARYQTANFAAYSLVGPYIGNAPSVTGSVGVLVSQLGPWFGGAQFRLLGPYPLIEDNSLRAAGYHELNLDVGYNLSSALKLQLNIFNLLNTKAYAAQYAYQYRLTAASAAGSGPTFHPIEPLSARLTLTATF